MTHRFARWLAAFVLALPLAAGAQTTTSTTLLVSVCEQTGAKVVVHGTALAGNACIESGLLATTSTSTTATTSSTTTSTSSSTVTTTSTSSTSTTIVGVTWGVKQGGTLSDNATAIANSTNNLFVGGAFKGTTTLGVTSGTPPSHSTATGTFDAFLVKYMPDGTISWSKRFGGTGDDYIRAVAADGAGDVYITGYFTNTVNFGGADLTATGTTGDIMLAKYSGANGAHLWSKKFGGTTYDEGLGLATDSANNVIMTGYFVGSINFGGATLTVPFTNDLDVFVAKFNSAGTHQWSKNFTNTGNEKGYSVAVDASDAVFVGGYFSNDVNFGGGVLSAVNGFIDWFVLKLDSSGTHVWSKRFGTPDGNDSVYAIAVDASNNVVATGYAKGDKAVDYGGGSLAGLGGGSDASIVKLAGSNGAHTWSKRVGGTQNDYGWGVATDGSSNVYWVGQFDSTSISVAGVTLTNPTSSNPDGFIAQFAANGTNGWAERLGGTAQDVPNKVVCSASGHCAVVGFFYGTATFDGTNLTSAGVADGFLVRMAQTP